MFLRLLSRPALTEAAAGTRLSPYVADAATRPWLRLVGLIVLAAVFCVLAAIAAGVVVALLGPDRVDPTLFRPPMPQWSLGRENVFLIALAAILMALALGVLFAAMIVYQRGVGAFLWPAQLRGWRLFGAGALVMLALQLLFSPLAFLMERDVAPPMAGAPLDQALIYVGVASLALLVAAAAEEIVFRGVLMRVIGGLTRRPIVTCVITGVLFSLVHFDPDPVAFVMRAFSGVVWAWAALRLGGVAFAVGAHWINNLFIALLLEPISSAALPGQDIPLPYIGVELVSTLVFLLAVEWLARRPGRG